MNKFTEDDADKVAKELGLSFDKFSLQDLLAGMNVEAEHSELTGLDPLATARIALDHLQERPDYYAKLKTCVENEKKPAQVFYFKHMTPGVVGYENENILVSCDTMKRMGPSMVGKPIFLNHQALDAVVEPDGYITDCFYNEADGWLWAKGIVVSDNAHEAISKGWGVSNAYVPIEWGSAGQYLNVDYGRQMMNGEFTHLAIVKTPRYEESRVFTPAEYRAYCEQKREELKELTNSKTEPKGVIKMLKLFKTEKKEVGQMEKDFDNIEVQLENGKTVSLMEMVNAVKKNADEEKEKKEEKMNEDTEIEVGDEKMPLKELINRYVSMNKKNEKVEVEVEKEKEEKEEKANSKEADHFQALLNAKKNPVENAQVIETVFDKLKRGKELY